jgi:hypothetical protein
MTELEREWRAQSTIELPLLNPELSLKLLHKLLIHNIYEIKHITLPNETTLMTPENFKTYSDLQKCPNVSDLEVW